MGQVEQPAGLAHGLPRVLVWVGYSVFHENPYPCDGSTGSSRVQTPLKMTSTVGFLSSAHHSKQTALLIKCFYVFVIMPCSVWKSGETGKKTVTGPDHNRPRPQLVKTGKDRETRSS